MVLSDEELESMKSSVWTCPRCKAEVRKNYCRDCDEYFNDGHEETLAEKELGAADALSEAVITNDIS